MAAPGHAPITVTLDGIPSNGTVPTEALLGAMLRVSEKVSDLIFSPGRPPQIKVDGQLVGVALRDSSNLTADDTRRIAADLIGANKQAINVLREQGSCDVSYGLAGAARFRVNVFIQRGSCAVVMRVIPTAIPDFASLRLPSHLGEIAATQCGIVLITGPTASGKSSTLAALLDRINSEYCYHIITVEDPIEFLHNHKRSTVHQRELHSDTPDFAMALRAAMRQAPKVILVGEMRDRETMETVLEAAETGHLVLSSMNTVDAGKTVERIIGAFPSDQQSVRSRLAKNFRFIVSQRLIPKSDRNGRIPVVEILKSTPATRWCMEHGEQAGKTFLDAITAGQADGMQHFDSEIAKLVRSGVINQETALTYATNPTVLMQELAG